MPEFTPLQQRSDAELIRLAHHTRGDIAKESLAALVLRRTERVTPLAVELLSDHADPQVRSLAAVTLGRRRDPKASAALSTSLRDTDPTVVRRAAQSLVRVGEENALAELSQMTVPADPAAARAVRTAKLLLGYRLGRTESLVRAADVTEFGRRRGEEITFGTRAKMPKQAIVESIAAEVPALAISAPNVRLFTCSGVAGALALDDGIGDVDLSVPHMLGVLARERACPGGYSLDCFVLSDDRDATAGREPYVWLVRPSGRLVHTGRALVEDGDVRFEVTGSVAPQALPVKVVGRRTANGAVSIETAIVGKPATDAPEAAVPPLRAR